jgi:hypothetical protein
MAGVIYGLFIAAVILLVEKFTPQPLGSAILWVAFAVQLAWPRCLPGGAPACRLPARRC